MSGLQWSKDKTKLESNYKNAKMTVLIKNNDITDITGWGYNNDDWDIMYDIVEKESEIKNFVTNKFLK